jgi:centromere protein C
VQGTGNAAQCFNVPQSSDICRWLSGSLKLPPGSIKDAEHVAVSTQLYWIMSGQPMSLELAVALPDDSSTTAEFDAETAQRYILSPGDHFYIPSNNVYRLENLSKTTECEISWVILRPFEDS